MSPDPPVYCLCPRLASPSPHRSPYKASPSRADRRKANAAPGGPLDDSQNGATTPKTPQVSLHYTHAVNASDMDIILKNQFRYAVMFNGQRFGTFATEELVS